MVRFVNGNFTVNGEVPDAAKFHYFFGRAAFNIPESLGTFNAVTYFTPGQALHRGHRHTYFLDGSTEPVYGLQFYPQDVIREELVVEAVGAVASRDRHRGRPVRLRAHRIAADHGDRADELAALDIEVIPLDQILGAIQYLPLNVGEALGHLRIFPPDNRRAQRPPTSRSSTNCRWTSRWSPG